ncbi:MAG: helix-turn-helix transcriptional regulator [Clostridia bacterium]|nr:helix-turn-helix transcriptional regulator [Clostridia bacterium]
MNSIVCAGKYSPNEDYKNRNFEIIIPDKSGTVSFGGLELKFNGGDVIAVPPFTRYFIPSDCGGLHAELEQAFLPVKEVTVFADDANGGVRHTILQAEEYLKSGMTKRDIILSALGNLLAGYVTAYCVKTEFSPVVELVRSDIGKNISNSSYALDNFIKKLPLNYDYVRKLFKKEVGATPHEYLTAQRMELAVSLLTGGASNKYSDYSVSQIAEACGFSEPLYFSRVFKKYYGVSPSEYKKK